MSQDSTYTKFFDKGFTDECAKSKADLHAKCVEAVGDAQAWFVPGRVEVLGKHTDYCGGRSVVAAVDQGIVIACKPRNDNKVTLVDATFQDRCEFEVSDQLAPTIGHWSNYPMTVARRLARDFSGPLKGADIALASDLVPAAGMSSSSALIIAIFYALSYANSLDQTAAFRNELSDLTHLASYVAAIEGGKAYGSFRADHGVGTAGGSEDHTAILCSIPGKLGVFSYRPVRLERHISFPGDHVLVICASGVVAEKTGAARELYNRASRLASEGCAYAAQSLISEVDDFATLARSFHSAEIEKALADTEYLTRFRHFDAESNRIIPSAVDALESGDLASWGRWVDESQQTGEELLGNQVPETIDLAKLARENGAVAASAFGAGFGGSVWAMVPADHASTFITIWKNAYLSQYPHYQKDAKFFITRPGSASFSLNS